MAEFSFTNCGIFRTCLSVVLLSAVWQLSSISEAKKIAEATEENCEVCVKFMTRFIESLDEDTKSNPAKIETAFRKFCKPTKGDDNRFCYYVGGLEESATGMLGEMSKPVSWSMPADKVCFKLFRKDEQICDLRYAKTYDYSKLDVKKLKVSELKAILSEWGEQCRGCSEKSDYVRLVEELMPRHAPDAAKTRSPNDL